jgi:hypothetical protein
MIRAIALALICATPAHANQCGKRDTVIIQLAEKYGESRQVAGLAQNGAMMEVFAAASGSWTITVTTADGQMCLVASGQAFERHNSPPAPLGVPG